MLLLLLLPPEIERVSRVWLLLFENDVMVRCIFPELLLDAILESSGKIWQFDPISAHKAYHGRLSIDRLKIGYNLIAILLPSSGRLLLFFADNFLLFPMSSDDI